MIELILEPFTAPDAAFVRAAVGARPGILVTDPNTCHLQERDDVDTLLNEGRVAGEFYGGRFPRTLGWVVVDDEQHLRCLVYEATITAIDNEHAQQTAKAAWIVYLALGAPFKFAEGGDPEAVREAERGWDSLAGEWDYPKFLNAFEVMARGIMQRGYCHLLTMLEFECFRNGCQA